MVLMASTEAKVQMELKGLMEMLVLAVNIKVEISIH